MFNAPPFTIIPANSSVAAFVLCDHASNHIPAPFENLGLSENQLSRHIAWDIGAQSLTQQVCNAFDIAGILAGFSRLLIDPNRDLKSDGLIPMRSDALNIPGNQSLSQEDINARIDTFYSPYHQELEAQIDELQERSIDPLIISIHSFTPKMASGAQRDLDIGLLWKTDEDLALRVKAAIENVHGYRVKLNAPYSALDLNHTLDRHVIARGLRHITFEVKQDLIDTKRKAHIMASHLTQALKHFIIV